MKNTFSDKQINNMLFEIQRVLDNKPWRRNLKCIAIYPELYKTLFMKFRELIKYQDMPVGHRTVLIVGDNEIELVQNSYMTENSYCIITF